jgi:hypothetical protein
LVDKEEKGGYSVRDENGNEVNIPTPSIHQILKAKKKAIEVIKSCENSYQFETAKSYVEQYLKFSQDHVGYKELVLELDKSKYNE